MFWKCCLVLGLLKSWVDWNCLHWSRRSIYRPGRSLGNQRTHRGRNLSQSTKARRRGKMHTRRNTWCNDIWKHYRSRSCILQSCRGGKAPRWKNKRHKRQLTHCSALNRAELWKSYGVEAILNGCLVGAHWSGKGGDGVYQILHALAIGVQGSQVRCYVLCVVQPGGRIVGHLVLDQVGRRVDKTGIAKLLIELGQVSGAAVLHRRGERAVNSCCRIGARKYLRVGVWGTGGRAGDLGVGGTWEVGYEEWHIILNIYWEGTDTFLEIVDPWPIDGCIGVAIVGLIYNIFCVALSVIDSLLQIAVDNQGSNWDGESKEAED